jgi:MtN3 and saliva related transmembrane protein
MIELIGYVATVLISIASFPQIQKSIVTKSTGDLSWGYIGLTMSSMILWLIYGLALQSVPLVISSIITILGYSILSCLKWREYGLSRIK